MKKLLFKIPLCVALIKSMRGYSARFFLADLKAALVVSMVALPLSMALAIAVGLPPQHGLYTAIVAGLVTPLLGGSKFQVTGPTAAFVVILAPIVTEFGLRGIIWCQIMAGIILILMGVTRIGRMISYVPYPVTTGFTAGIAVVILTLSLKDMLGLDINALPESYIGKVSVLIHNIGSFNPYELLVSLITLFLITFSGRVIKTIPSPVIAIGAATIAAIILEKMGYAHITTIADKFYYLTANGYIIHGIPPQLPSMNIPGISLSKLFLLPSTSELKLLFLPSFIIALLAGLESLLSATVADSLADTRHEPNAELNAIGIANILSGMFSGIPATGAIARTATMIHAGAKSPIASSLHAVFIILFMLFLSKYVNMIPLASLSAVLFITAIKMSQAHQVNSIMRSAPINDRIVLAACLLSTALINMVTGVLIGVTLASLLFMKRVSELTTIETVKPRALGRRLLAKVPEDTLLFRVQGPLFFGTAERAFDRTALITKRTKKMILDLSETTVIDLTGIRAINSLVARARSRNIKVFICCDKRIELKLHSNLQRDDLYTVLFFSELPNLIKALG